MKPAFVALVLALAMGLAPSVASARQPADMNAVIAGIATVEFYNQVDDLRDSASVRIVRLSTLAGARQSAARLHEVEETHGKARAIRYLQRTLTLNWTGMHALKYSGVSLDQIVYLSVASDGAAILYADDL
jgi:hypothetical protein